MEGKDDEINTYNKSWSKYRKWNRITHPINEIKIWINKLLFADANIYNWKLMYKDGKEGSVSVTCLSVI